jgi:hypothetical protein
MFIALATAAAIAVVILAFVAYRVTRSGGENRANLTPNLGASVVPRRSIRDSLHFMAGPLPISISLHVLVVIGLLWGVHLEQGRNFITVDLAGGGGSGGGGGTDELKQLDLPEMVMPESAAPMPIEHPVVTASSAAVVSAASHYVRTVVGGGIGTGYGGGIGSGYGQGIGNGFGGFIGGLRKTGLDVTLVIDGTGSMSRIIGDVKDKMGQLVLAIHRMVPTARIGLIVFGGRGEPIQVEALTVSPDKLLYFLGNIQARGGGEWQEDTLGAVRTAVNLMGWRSYAKKVIVLVGDTPPFDEDNEPTFEEIRRFRMEDGTFNTVDVTVEEHERFVEDWTHNQGEPPPDSGKMPRFYFLAQHAYKAMAAAGGGSWRSLTKDDQINQQVLILAFGTEWQADVAAFGHNMSASPSRVDP